MEEKDVKCGYSTIVAINREVEELKVKVAKLESGEVDDLEGLTKAQLEMVAENCGVEVGGLKKADMIEAIRDSPVE